MLFRSSGIAPAKASHAEVESPASDESGMAERSTSLLGTGSC